MPVFAQCYAGASRIQDSRCKMHDDTPSYPSPLKGEGMYRLGEVFVEGEDDEGCGEDEHHIAEGDAEYGAFRRRDVIRGDDAVLSYNLTGFR